MIKTIEIAPDIYAKGLANFLADRVDDFTYVSNLYDEACIRKEALEMIIKEYMNAQ